MAEAVGFEPTCPCGQLHFECSSLQPLRYASMYKYSLLGTNHMISSQSRYDHFDTAPYLSQHQHLGKRGELMGRTSKNIKLRIPEKPHKIKGFRSGSYRVATTISSQGRYNHFDTTPRGAERVSACYYSRRRAENQAFRCACGAVRGKFFRGCNFCLPFSSLSVQRDGARPRRGAPRAKS